MDMKYLVLVGTFMLMLFGCQGTNSEESIEPERCDEYKINRAKFIFGMDAKQEKCSLTTTDNEGTDWKGNCPYTHRFVYDIEGLQQKDSAVSMGKLLIYDNSTLLKKYSRVIFKGESVTTYKSDCSSFSSYSFKVLEDKTKAVILDIDKPDMMDGSNFIDPDYVTWYETDNRVHRVKVPPSILGIPHTEFSR
jgi:hypothetical protein